MANVFKFLKPKASLSRNGFDLSQRHIYSIKAGMKVPVLCIDTLPNDYHEIDVLSLVRSMPVQTDAFTRLKCSFEFGFVPYWQVWNKWNEFITQTQEHQQYIENNSLPTQVPTVSLANLLQAIIWRFMQDWMRVNILTPAVPYYTDMFGFEQCHNMLRLLDMLGYGSYYSYVDQARLDLETLKAEGWSSDAFDDLYQQYVGDTNETFGNTQINLLRLCCYHKFMDDYCRSSIYEPQEPRTFDLEYLSNNLTDNGANGFYYGSMIHYGMYNKDKFTALYPSPQFGSVSSVDLGTFEISAVSSDSSSNNPVNVSRTTGRLYNAISQDAFNYNFTSSASIDVYQLRKAEMFQKWKEDKLRAGNKIKDQATAMWGQPFKYALENYSEYIKEITFNVSIDEVTNMSASGGATLGEIAGKGIGTGNGKVSFKCQDFGCLVCVMSIVPISEYDAIGLDKNNTLAEPFDFATPHFENLGLESIHGYELNTNPYVSEQYSPSYLFKTLGYAPRYLNYKTAVDKVHGEFMSVGHVNELSDGSPVDAPGTLYSWSTPRTDMEKLLSANSYAIEFLHVNPSVLDPIFLQNCDSYQTTDQFLVNTNFAIKSVRSLSVLGLPRW